MSIYEKQLNIKLDPYDDHHPKPVPVEEIKVACDIFKAKLQPVVDQHKIIVRTNLWWIIYKNNLQWHFQLRTRLGLIPIEAWDDEVDKILVNE